MNGSRANRMRSVEHAFLDVVTRTQFDRSEEADPLRILSEVDVARDGSVQTASVEALLLAELAAWQWLGLRLGYFEGKPGFEEEVRSSDVLKIFFELENRAGPIENEPSNPGEFQSALIQSLEDLRPERIELVRLLTVATNDEFEDRLKQLQSASPTANRSHDPEQTISSVGWVLSGRESAIEGWPGPAAWRSNRALVRSPRWGTVNSIGAGIATRVLLEVLGEENSAEIAEAVFRETGEGGVAYA